MRQKISNLIYAWILGFGVMATVLPTHANAANVLAASVVARIDISQQVMRVYVNGIEHYSWRVSTGRRGYYTPRGRYRPTVMKRMHYSSKYNNSPMPWSIFFKGGYAIHGTNYISRLGRPASHGCIRLHPAAARKLYSLMRRHRGRSRIIITN